MKDLLTFFTAMLAFFICYALTASLIAAVWCLKYIDVVQNPVYIFFGAVLALCSAIIAGDAVQKAEL